MAYTEFCIRASGSNLNAGTLDGIAEPTTAAAFTYSNGSWVSGTGVFTPASGNPQSDGVAVGNFCSVYTDGGSPPAFTSFVGRVTAVSTTTITVSITAKSGTVPTTGSNITARVGGAWSGPTGSTAFPVNFADGLMTNSSANNLRVNWKNDQTYTVSAQMADNAGGVTVFQGYSATYGDFGKFDLTGGSSGASYNVLSINHNDVEFRDMILHGNGATSNAHMVSTSGNRNAFTRCVFHDCRGGGVNTGTSRVIFTQCEFYNCNQSNNSGYGGIVCGQAVTCINCVFHSNTGSNTSGVQSNANNLDHVFDRCIFDSNGQYGLTINCATLQISDCDFYNNGSDGAFILGNVNHNVVIVNCNFVKNTGWGVNIDNTNPSKGYIVNCGFGTGTQANGSGTTNIGAKSSIENQNNVNYASNLTPWTTPSTGDFRINLATAESAGFGAFTQTATSYAGAIAYPDIGSCQHLPGSQPIANPVIMVSKGAVY